MRDRLDDTLDAEQQAARAAALRRRSLRDRLLEAEDRVEAIVVSTSDGHFYRGVVDAVGVDHIVLVDGDTERLITIAHVVAMETR